jgi:hypothetical protein
MRVRNKHLPVKASRASEGLIENLGEVRGCDDHDPLARRKAILCMYHFGEELIKRHTHGLRILGIN